MQEILLDVRVLMWILTLVGIAIIKFNDMKHLTTAFKELKEDVKSILEKIESISERIEANKERISEIDVRCEEREKRFNEMIALTCSKDKKTRKKRKKAQ